MAKRWLFFLLLGALTAGMVWVLNRPFGQTPAFGFFLSPSHGFWQNAEPANPSAERSLSLPGVKSEVKVVWDNRWVPHIFAQNDYDLYYTQGYVHASQRLWQMELQTYAAAGRIAEILGPGEDSVFIKHDLFRRKTGMLYAAEQTIAAMDNDPTSKLAVEAYVQGVNDYINSLSAKDYPLEYKLLSYEPEQWSAVKTALLLKFMSWDLSGYSDDLPLTRSLEKIGMPGIADLFPNYPARMDPIIPPDTKWDFTPVEAPPVPKETKPDSLKGAGSIPLAVGPAIAPSTTPQPAPQAAPAPTNPAPTGTPTAPGPSGGPSGGKLPFDARPHPGNGSNNWAVAGEKTESGYPLLANDPHLGLRLPSLWFEMQLTSPSCNVYGVSLPGAPAIIIGYNEKVAWGVTNVDADVLDWYRITFKDKNLDKYLYNGAWKTIAKALPIEVKVRGGGSVLDTLIFTHHGPIPYMPGETPFEEYIPTGCAMRWLAHDPSNELITFIKLNRAQTIQDYEDALKTYVCPAQNFVYADSYNNIALWCNGKYPLKWKTQGKFLLDGSRPEHDWQGWIPQAHNPHVKNPPRQFVSSANQFSADTTYPYYLNWAYEAFERGERINQVLAKLTKATWDDMRALQNDNYNLMAEWVLPRMLKGLAANGLPDGKYQQAYEALKGWNLKNDADQVGATIFKIWYEKLEEAIWADEFKADMMMPSRDRTAALIVKDSTSKWYDDVRTPKAETLNQLLASSFASAVDSLNRYATDSQTAWQWATFKSTDIMHPLKIGAFSRKDLMIGGGRGIVNATRETNGPSWRMVVALGKTPQGYGIYPGGQSGNPGNRFYDNMVDTWVEGKLDALLFFRNPDDQADQQLSVWTVSPQ